MSEDYEQGLENIVSPTNNVTDTVTKRYDLLLNELMEQSWVVPRSMIKSYAFYHQNITRKTKQAPRLIKSLAKLADGFYASFLIGRLPASDQNKAAQVTNQKAWLYSIGNEVITTALMTPLYVLAFPIEISAGYLTLSAGRTVYVLAKQKPLGPLNPETIIYKTGQYLFSKKKALVAMIKKAEL